MSFVSFKSWLTRSRCHSAKLNSTATLAALEIPGPRSGLPASNTDTMTKPERTYKVKPRLTYNTVSGVNGPLVILDKIKFPTYNEIVTLVLPDGSEKTGQVLESRGMFFLSLRRRAMLLISPLQAIAPLFRSVLSSRPKIPAILTTHAGIRRDNGHRYQEGRPI
jgi:hypothetical protein